MLKLPIAALVLVPASPLLAAEGDDFLQFRGSFNWTNAALYSEIRPGSPYNPDNTVLRLPHVQLVSDFRPDFKITSKSLSLIARPRVRLSASEVEVAGDKEDVRGKSRGTVNEAYAQWTLNETALFAYGLQNFQWGAAEALSPSNRIFHETALARNALYEVRGRHIARLNLSFGKALSLVMMSEFKERTDDEAGDEPEFLAGEEFSTTTLGKLEYAWNAGSDYFGIVVGGREKGKPWVGEYFSWSLPFLDGFSLYADASHERGSRAYYPVTSTVLGPVVDGTITGTDVIAMQQAEVDEEKVYTLAVAGLRFDFVSGAIVRAEYVHNEAGYSAEENSALHTALTSAAPAQLALREEALSRALAPGLELPGQRYAFASYSHPNAAGVQDLTLYARGLRSLTDGSTNLYASADYGVGQAGTVFGAAAGAIGAAKDELAGLSEWSTTAGYKHSW